MKTKLVIHKHIRVAGKRCQQVAQLLWLSTLLAFSVAVNAQTPILCGQTVTNTTTATNQVDQYTYAGNAGQVLSIALWGPVSCPNDYMVADIYNPSNQLVASLSSLCTEGNALKLPLTNTGTYTVLVHEDLYRNTGSYALSVQSVMGGGCDGRTLTCGQTVATNTTFRSQMDAYSYAGTAGQVLSVAISGMIGCPYDYMVVDVHNPGGQLVASLYPDCHQGDALSLTLTNSGTFTLLVHESYYRNTGSYSLSLQSVTGGGCNSRAIICGQTVAASTTANSQMDAYSYAGTAGQVLSIALAGPIGCPYDYMVVDMYNPSGQLVASLLPPCNSGATLDLSLTNTGTYTLLVHEYIYRATGNYSLGLTVSNGCDGLYLGSANVRTQEVVCLPLEIISSSPVVWISFTVQAPPGVLAEAKLNATGQFTNANIASVSNSQWIVTMQTSGTNGVLGDQLIGSVCFTAASTQTAFAQVTLKNLVVTNQDGTVPGATAFGSRVVIIANEALLEATLGSNGQRMLTIYGKANTDYEIQQATNIRQAVPWAAAFTNKVPSSLFLTSALQGSFSNAPMLFLRAREK